ncbi:MAG: hypothetical protein ACTH7Q_08140 [Pseudoalteromonas sp.]
MYVYKVLFFVALILFVNVSNAKSVLPSNKSQFVKLLNNHLGSYKLTSGNSDICSSGELSWHNKNETDLGFSLGSGIIFNALHNGTQTNKVSSFCLVTTKFKYTSEGLTMTLRHNRCENDSDNLDTSQTLRFLADHKIQYSIENTDVECNFELQRL